MNWLWRQEVSHWSFKVINGWRWLAAAFQNLRERSMWSFYLRMPRIELLTFFTPSQCSTTESRPLPIFYLVGTALTVRHQVGEGKLLVLNERERNREELLLQTIHHRELSSLKFLKHITAILMSGPFSSPIIMLFILQHRRYTDAIQTEALLLVSLNEKEILFNRSRNPLSSVYFLHFSQTTLKFSQTLQLELLV